MRWRVTRTPPAAAIWVVSASPVSFTSTRARWQPRRASESEMARPIPPSAPVTTAVRCASLMILAIDRASCGLLLGRGTPERHRAVIHSAQPQRRQVKGIVLMQPPRLFGPLLWEDGSCPLDIARGQADRGFLYDGRIATARRTPRIPLRVHVVQKT